MLLEKSAGDDNTKIYVTENAKDLILYYSIFVISVTFFPC